MASSRTRQARPRAPSALDDLGALHLFAQVIDTRSLTAAARLHGTTTSAVSKRIAGLESRLSVRLIERSSRGAQPTEAGLVLYEHAQRLLADAQAAEDAVSGQRGELRGTLRISAPVTFGQMHIAPLVLQFLELHPGLRIVLSLSDRAVDLIGEGIDLAVRAGKSDDSSLLSRALAPDRRVVCGAPHYFKRHGTPKRPADLIGHACLKHPLMATARGWSFESAEGPITIPVTGRLEVDNIAALRDAALAGFGITRVPAYAIAAELRAGTLISVLDELAPATPPFRALWAAGKHRPARLRAVIDYIASELPKRLA
jgi:DNA-binding transcriptional LysR family regulator